LQKTSLIFSTAIIYSILGLALLIQSGCNDNEQNITNSKSTNKKSNSSNHDKGSILISNDTLVIRQKCAVIVTPDSIQIKRRQKELGEDFYIGLDDYLFYLNESQDFFNQVKLKTISCDGKKFLKFLQLNKTTEIIDLSNLDELYKIYLFEPTKPSKQIDMTITKDEYNQYFQ
jgi:hypothetical protein